MSRAPTWTLANGTINTTSHPGVDGGVYNASVELNTYLSVIDIVESIPTSVPNLPTCGVSPSFKKFRVLPTNITQQMCLSAELSLVPSFGCSPSNYTCLCASTPFMTAFRDCLVDSCDSVDETQESKDYFNEFCAEEGIYPATPSPIMSSSAM